MALELIEVETSDGVGLAGTLRTPEGAAGSHPSVDAWILHHGTGGKFYFPFGGVEQQLVEWGWPVLRVNNRGHDLVYGSPTGRLLGAAYEVVHDCRLDWRAWLDFAESKGYQRIGLLGHSLGALKTIYYLALEGDDRVPCAVALSPPRFSYTDYVSKEGAEHFLAFYERARQLVGADDTEGLMVVDLPLPMVIAARNYIDKYGPDERYDILKHLPNVPVPILVIIGGDEGVGPEAPYWLPLGGLANKVAKLAERHTNLTFQFVPGLDHSYRTAVEAQVPSILRSWLENWSATALENDA